MKLLFLTAVIISISLISSSTAQDVIRTSPSQLQKLQNVIKYKDIIILNKNMNINITKNNNRNVHQLSMPQVTSVSQSTFGIAGGTVMTLTGSGFNVWSNLKFYIISQSLAVAPSSISSDGTQAVVAFGSWNLNDGTKSNLNIYACSTDFTPCANTGSVQVSYQDPVITDVFPQAWCAVGGTKITLTGTNFGQGAVAAAFYTYISVTDSVVVSPKFDGSTSPNPSPTQIVSGGLPSHAAGSVWHNVYLAWATTSFSAYLNGGMYVNC